MSTSAADEWLHIICINPILHSFALCLLTVVKRYDTVVVHIMVSSRRQSHENRITHERKKCTSHDRRTIFLIFNSRVCLESLKNNFLTVKNSKS